MKKFEMLFEIAKDCIEPEDKAKHFAFMCKEHKSVEECNKLYNEWKSGAKNKEYFTLEIIGYTEAKKNAYMKRHNIQ